MMLLTTKKTTPFYATVTLIVLLHVTAPVNANQNEGVLEPYELKARLFQHKRQLEINSEHREALLVMPSSRHLDVTTFDNYDEFVITITNQQGFRKQVRNTYGSVDINDVDLPYDGEYDYEILAIKNTGEVISDVINNGRGDNASTTVMVTKKVSGHFITNNGSIVIPEVVNEPKPGTLPSKVDQLHDKREPALLESNKTRDVTFPSKPERLPVNHSFFGEEK